MWWSRRSSVYWLLPQVFSANCMIVKLSITSTYLWLLRGAAAESRGFIMFHSYASPFLTLVIIVTNKPIHHWLSVSYLLYHKWLTLSDFIGGNTARTADVKSWWGNNSINPVSISPENEHDTSQMMRLLLLDTSSSTSEMAILSPLSPRIVVYDDQYKITPPVVLSIDIDKFLFISTFLYQENIVVWMYWKEGRWM